MDAIKPDPRLAEAIRRMVGEVPLQVDPRDEMLSNAVELYRGNQDVALFQYFVSGRNAAAGIRQIAGKVFGGTERVGRILDFAAGYGRISRFLLRDFPPDRLIVSDINSDAMAFQEENFGLRTVLSAADPGDLEISESFDLVIASSLFTHLPEARFGPWLHRLVELSGDGGLLLFSAKGPEHMGPGRWMGKGGFFFAPHSESSVLDRAEYGTAVVSEDFVRETLAAAFPGAGLLRIARGWLNFQDLYLVDSSCRLDLAALEFDPGGEGSVDDVLIRTPGRLWSRGWVIDRSVSHRVERVELVVDGEVIGSSDVSLDRGDVLLRTGNPRDRSSGWEIDVPVPEGVDLRRSVLMIRAISSGAVESALLFGTIETELARTAARLERQLAGMRESRFWKIRNRWFALKRRLGLTDEL